MGISCGLQSQSQSNATAQTGILKLGLSTSSRDGYIFVPDSYNPSKTNPMILAIHAAGKGGLDALGILIDQANSSGAPCKDPVKERLYVCLLVLNLLGRYCLKQ